VSFSPYSKQHQLRGHKKKDKDTPKYKEKRPKKKKLKQEVYKGRTIPTKKTRGAISKKDYEKAVVEHGDYCFFCKSFHNLEMHHVIPKGYSRHKNGRGVYRNLRLLCSSCHRGENGVHQNRDMMEQLQQEHERLYGPNFYKDRFDLFKEGIIPNTDSVTFENYMEGEEEKCRMKSGISGNGK
jgi:5-methylcytosine-specific restriction endonuclease McrA